MPTRTVSSPAPVQRGAALLDFLDPKWFNKVTTAILDMKSTDVCVLGQIHNDYISGLEVLASQAVTKMMRNSPLVAIKASHGTLASRLATLMNDWGVDLNGPYYGFHVKEGHEEDNAAWEKLALAWTNEIQARKPAAKKPAAKKKVRRA